MMSGLNIPSHYYLELITAFLPRPIAYSYCSRVLILSSGIGRPLEAPAGRG